MRDSGPFWCSTLFHWETLLMEMYLVSFSPELGNGRGKGEAQKESPPSSSNKPTETLLRALNLQPHPLLTLRTPYPLPLQNPPSQSTATPSSPQPPSSPSFPPTSLHTSSNPSSFPSTFFPLFFAPTFSAAAKRLNPCSALTPSAIAHSRSRRASRSRTGSTGVWIQECAGGRAGKWWGTYAGVRCWSACCGNWKVSGVGVVEEGPASSHSSPLALSPRFTFNRVCGSSFLAASSIGTAANAAAKSEGVGFVRRAASIALRTVEVR